MAVAPGAINLRRSGATETIFASMFVLARGIDRLHQSGHLRRATGVDLDRALHPVVITIGERGPLRSTALAETLALCNSTISRHVSVLAELGIVQKAVDDDRRAALLTLTPAGRKALRAIRAAWEAHIDATLAAAGLNDAEQFADQFATFADAFGADHGADQRTLGTRKDLS